MNSIATVLFLASTALAAPQYYYQPGNQYYYQPGYGPGYGYGNYQPQQAYRPQPLNTFRYAQNPLRSAPLQSPTPPNITTNLVTSITINLDMDLAMDTETINPNKLTGPSL